MPEPISGRENVARQLQLGDPSTPAAAMETLARAWANWRMQQAADASALDVPVALTAPGQGLGKLVSEFVASQASMPRVPIAKEARRVRPTTESTPGQPSPQELLPGGLYEAQQAEASFPAAYTNPIAKKNAAELRGDFKRPAAMRKDYETGQWNDTWYVGAFPKIAEEIMRLAQVAPRGVVDVQKDAPLVAKLIASTSPQAEPNWNVTNALRSYVRLLKGDRAPEAASAGQMQGYALNIERSVRGEPIEGMKVSNFLLNILGSEQNATVDRWMVNSLLGRPSAKANVSDTEYQVAADRIRELAGVFKTTPARAQAAMWTGAKMLRDERMHKLLGQGLTREQAVPAFRDVISQKMEQLRGMVKFDPSIITPAMALGAVLLEESQREEGAHGG